MSFSLISKSITSTIRCLSYYKSPLQSFIVGITPAAKPILSTSAFSTLTQNSAGTAAPVAGGAWSLLFSRTNIRNNWQRPRETKRVKVSGWWQRISTPTGRRVLMRRILKGRHVLSH